MTNVYVVLQYVLDPYTGTWKHRTFTYDSQLFSLGKLTYSKDGLFIDESYTPSRKDAPTLSNILARSRKLYDDAVNVSKVSDVFINVRMLKGIHFYKI